MSMVSTIVCILQIHGYGFFVKIHLWVSLSGTSGFIGMVFRKRPGFMGMLFRNFSGFMGGTFTI